MTSGRYEEPVHVCDYVEPEGWTVSNAACHLRGTHGDRCHVCHQTARRCGHQPHRLTTALCGVADCRVHREPETRPCLVRVAADDGHVHRCARVHEHRDPHRCRECGRDYETAYEVQVRSDDPLADYVDADGVRHAWDYAGSRSWDATPDWFHPDPRRSTCRDRSCPGNRPSQVRALPLVRVVTGDPGTPSATDDYLTLNVHVAPPVDADHVRARLVEFVRDLDWELRRELLTETGSATATVRPDQPTEPTGDDDRD